MPFLFLNGYWMRDRLLTSSAGRVLDLFICLLYIQQLPEYLLSKAYVLSLIGFLSTNVLTPFRIRNEKPVGSR